MEHRKNQILLDIAGPMQGIFSCCGVAETMRLDAAYAWQKCCSGIDRTMGTERHSAAWRSEPSHCGNRAVIWEDETILSRKAAYIGDFQGAQPLEWPFLDTLLATKRVSAGK